jgi:hypothetical protein
MARLLLSPASGGARVDARYARMNTSNAAIVAAMTDAINPNVEYVAAGALNAYATIATVNNVDVFDLSNTESVSAPVHTRYSWDSIAAGAAGQTAFTMAALWKTPASFTSLVRRVLLQLDADLALRAALRFHSELYVEARCQRSDGTLSIVDLKTRAEGDWHAAAVECDLGGDTLRLYDLLGDAADETEIDGTSGAALTGADSYSVGNTTAGIAKFTGQLADAMHLPYALTAADLAALRAHMRARAAALSAA